MITLLVGWFGGSPIPYFLVGMVFLCVFAGLAALPESRFTAKRGFEIGFVLWAGMTLLAWRWPTFLWQNPMNPDEGLWIAAAMKSTVDWVPWRGFDLGTSGPLSAYILAVPALLGLRIDFFSTRLLGVCLFTITIAGLFYAMKWLNGPRSARLAVVPPVVLLAVTKDWNFLHFSSEVVPICLTTTAFAAGAYLAGEGRPRSNRFIAVAIAGLGIGSAGLAKTQALPIALFVGIFVLAAIFWTSRHAYRRAKVELFVFMVSLLAVPATIAAVLRVTSGWQDALKSYLGHAVGYVGRGKDFSLSFPFTASPSYTAFLVSSLLVVFVAATALLWQRKKIPLWSLGAGSASLSLLVAAAFAIYTPAREFPHYLLFSIVPVSCCVASVLDLTRGANLWRDRETWIASIYSSLFLISAFAVSMSSAPTSFLNQMAFNSRWIGSNQAIAIARYARPGDRVAVWGSRSEYLVQTGTIMATRYPQMVPSSEPLQQFYEENMLRDLQQHLPRVFVDAVTQDAFQYNDRTTQGYETFPALAALINDRFVLKEEVDGVRIFVQKDM